jgi:type I restriction enzyme S subunit
VTSLIDGPFGSAFSSSDYVDEGPAVVRLGNIGFAEYRTDDQARIPLALYERFGAYAVRSGDVLIAGLGDARNHAGRACVAPTELAPAIVKGKCFRARVDERRAGGKFISLLLSSPIGANAVGISGRGSTRSMINLEAVKGTEVPLPNREVQTAIVAAAIGNKTASRRAAAAIRRQILLLDERRRALITAAVTGAVQVPVT